VDVGFEVGNLVGDGGGEGKARVSITAKFEHALDDIIVHQEGPIIVHMASHDSVEKVRPNDGIPERKHAVQPTTILHLQSPLVSSRAMALPFRTGLFLVSYPFCVAVSSGLDLFDDSGPWRRNV
jgi:hypothetical protein